MEMLILRRKGSGGLEGTPVPVGTGAEIEAVVRDLAPSEVRDLQWDETVLGAAQSMPMMLIEPVPASDPVPAAPAAGDVAWGIKAVGAATSPFTGRGVTVAVLDTGIDRGHPAFADVEIIPRNFTGGDPLDVKDTNGHGTHCAGTIFGRAVKLEGQKGHGTRIGVAPWITKAVIGKVLGPGGCSTATLFTAINWAIENKAQLISMSLGMDLVGYRDQLEEQGMHPKQASSTAMRVLIDNVRFFDKFGNLLRSGAAFGRSALIVAASGNESDRFGNPSFVLRAAYPGATEDFLSVGALEQTGDECHPFRVATFSNAGAKIAGPGVGIVSSVPGERLGVKSGTSMATPHIAGVAALWAQKIMLNSVFTAEKVLESLKSFSHIPPGLDDADVGVGIPQAPQS
jgi:subtilisin family serine protease